MKKILFLHGFFASGNCDLASTLRHELCDVATLLSPDLPLTPHDALEKIYRLCQTEKPDLLVGNSCGAFYAQIVSQRTLLPALLGNPHFEMTNFLRQRLGEHKYKSPRANAQQNFTITPALVNAFSKLESEQFVSIPQSQGERVWGLFGEKDTLAHYEPLFLQHYTHSFHFPGNHTPTAEEVVKWYVPLIRKLLQTT